MIGQSVVTWGRTAQRLSMLIILISGIYLVADRWEFSDFLRPGAWRQSSRSSRSRRRTSSRRPSGSSRRRAGREDEAQAIAGQQQVMGPIAGLIVILTIYVMTAKPFL